MSLDLRPVRVEDEAFLFDVYSSTRSEEMALVAWDETVRESFLAYAAQGPAVFLRHAVSKCRLPSHRARWPSGRALNSGPVRSGHSID